MVYKVIITKPAEADVEQSFSFIKQHSPEAAVTWLTTIQNAIQSLDSMPARGALIPEKIGSGFTYRHLIYGSHRIVFRVDETTRSVFIVRVYHWSRLPLRAQDF